VPLLEGRSPGEWRHVALVEHQGHDGDRKDPDMPAPHSGNPPTYAALRLEDALYVEYASGAKEYYDLKEDPFELDNVVARLPAARAQSLYEILHENQTCQGTQACWRAQTRRP
jgi:hypothetical protein